MPTTRKAKSSGKKADNEKLKMETLKEEQLFKSLPRDLQWEILTDVLGTHVVRRGRLMRRLDGGVQRKLLDSMPQKPTRIGRPLHLGLKSSAIEGTDGNQWTKHFDGLGLRESQGLQGSRSLSVIEDSEGNPSYRYVSRIVGKDDVDIITPIDNSIVLAPFVKHDYPSYNGVRGNITSKARYYNPKKQTIG